MRWSRAYWVNTLVFLNFSQVNGFLPKFSSHETIGSLRPLLRSKANDVDDGNVDAVSSRREIFKSALIATSSLVCVASLPNGAHAAVGTLPEFADTNAILQGITVNVADKAQQDAMIDFLVGGFDFAVQRKRIKDSVEETVRLPFNSHFLIVRISLWLTMNLFRSE
jgi:hypothetical protein